MKKIKLFVLAAVLFGLFVSYGAEKDFKLGVYIYDYAFVRHAKSDGVPVQDFIDKHFKILHDSGANVIHLTVTDPTGKAFKDIWLPALKKHQLKAYLQLDFAYFVPGKNWTEKHENKQAAKAGEFIKKFKNTPEILGFSIREEVAHKDVNDMARYYQKIMGYAEDFPIFTLHNNFGAAKDQPVPDPVIYGTDRYAFWWEYSAGGYMASPAFALNWTRNEAAKYYREAARRGADFMLVVTSNGYVSGSTDIMKSWGKRKFFNRIKKYAADNRFGWNKSTINTKEMYWVWKYYRLPENCVRALIWTGILEGAKTVLFWSYTPPAKADMKITPAERLFTSIERSKRFSGSCSYLTLAGRDGFENRELKEFAAAAKELKPYKNLIPKMRKIEKSVLKTAKNKKFFNRSFTFNGLKGKAVVIHNADVGTWGANSRYFFNEKDDIKIDALGNLKGYIPLTQPAKAEFALVNKQDKVFDFITGKQIPTVDGKGSVSIIPGGGRIIFVGTENEFKKISLR